MVKKITISFLLLVSILVLFIFFGTINFKKEAELVKNITVKTRLIDSNIDHNQALDVIDFAKEQGISIPPVIVNFDMHSDTYVQKKIADYGANIGNWINEFFISNEKANTLYWVLPEEFSLDKEMQGLFTLTNAHARKNLMGNVNKEEKLVNPYVNKYPYVQYMKINLKDGYMDEILPENGETPTLGKSTPQSEYKIIKVVTCTQNTLPDLNNQDLFLSLDMDYISNSGYDTCLLFKNNKSLRGISLAILNMLETLNRQNVRPSIISMTLSPKYVPREDEIWMHYFFKRMFLYTGQKDKIKKYKRFDNPHVKQFSI